MMTTQDALLLERNAAQLKTVLGEEYGPAIQRISSAIATAIDTSQLGILETYSLVCSTLKADHLITSAVMAAAWEQAGHHHDEL